MMNSCNFVGRLTKDPELKKTQNGISVCTFTIAVQRDIKDRNGNYQADFINCRAWRQQADFLCQYGRKGSVLGVSGRNTTESYTDRNGANRYVNYINVVSLDKLDRSEQQLQPEQQQYQYQTQTQQTSYSQPVEKRLSTDDEFERRYGGQTSQQSVSNGQMVDISDDELPF